MSIPIRVRHIDIPAGRRIVAISDVHAHGHWLRALLDKVAFGADDTLILVGDILERGPDSLGTLREVMALTARWDVHQVIGNVDEWAIEKVFAMDARQLCDDVRRFMGWRGGSFALELARGIGMDITPDMDVAAYRDGIRQAYAAEFAFLRALPAILHTRDYTFVHGGYDPATCDTLPGTPSRGITKRDAFMEEGRVMPRYTVVGHWPVCLYTAQPMRFSPVVSAAQRIIAIDGGCGIKSDGQLNALLLQNGAWAWACHSDMPVRAALDAQAAAGTGHCVTYMDGEVDIVRDEGDVALVRHLPSGYELYMPTTYLYQNKDGVWRANEGCDRRLPVEAGEPLTIMAETSRGTFCRGGDGLVGWYDGRLGPAGEAAPPTISAYKELP